MAFDVQSQLMAMQSQINGLQEPLNGALDLLDKPSLDAWRANFGKGKGKGASSSSDAKGSNSGAGSKGKSKGKFSWQDYNQRYGTQHGAVDTVVVEPETQKKPKTTANRWNRVQDDGWKNVKGKTKKETSVKETLQQEGWSVPVLADPENLRSDEPGVVFIGTANGYQGTTLGPPLWNVFFSDSESAVAMNGCTNITYADDLNAYKAFAANTAQDAIREDMKTCQSNLHRWGRANRVTFDPTKESFHTISHVHPEGDDFHILGCIFDAKLTMEACIQKLVGECKWKSRQLLRCWRYFNVSDNNAFQEPDFELYRISYTGNLSLY